MTLVFALDAVRRLARPEAVLEAARGWSAHVGVVADAAPEAVSAALDEADADPDFVSGTGGTTSSLAAVRQQFPTDRHVYVGTDDTERTTVQALGWEYLPIEEAAEEADWSLVDDTGA